MYIKMLALVLLLLLAEGCIEDDKEPSSVSDRESFVMFVLTSRKDFTAKKNIISKLSPPWTLTCQHDCQ